MKLKHYADRAKEYARNVVNGTVIAGESIVQ